jgi:hypothetical protein
MTRGRRIFLRKNWPKKRGQAGTGQIISSPPAVTSLFFMKIPHLCFSPESSYSFIIVKCTDNPGLSFKKYAPQELLQELLEDRPCQAPE